MTGLKASLKNENSPSGGRLAEAILHLYENPKERFMRGEAGHRHFLQHFERQGVLNRYIETIQNVLKSP